MHLSSVFGPLAKTFWKLLFRGIISMGMVGVLSSPCRMSVADVLSSPSRMGVFSVLSSPGSGMGIPSSLGLGVGVPHVLHIHCNPSKTTSNPQNNVTG